jgi:ketosteroid isomerase-like protein
MKPSLVAFILLLSPFLLSAQSTPVDQIDEQVWRPFQSSYAAGDAEAFNALHTDDVLRITSTKILQGEAYKAQNIYWMSKEERSLRSIDFRFEQRVQEEAIAYEVGYYEISIEGKDEAHYGRFHVVLKKVDDQWKIAQDWDTDNVNGTEVTAEDFKRLPEWK